MPISLRDIPNKGKRRAQKIEMFISRGILEVDKKGDIEMLVNRLFSSIWMQIESTIENHLCHADNGMYILSAEGSVTHTVFRVAPAKPATSISSTKGQCARIIRISS